MLSTMDFIHKSLELNLFFLRIMKEHLYFIELALTPKNESLSRQAENLRKIFDSIFAEAIMLSNGIINAEALKRGEIITEYTLKAEMATSFFTGKRIDTRLTQDEANLKAKKPENEDIRLEKRVNALNQRIMTAMASLIQFKSSLIANVNSCKIFITIYPTMLEHLLHEAKFYLSLIQELQNRNNINIEKEAFKKEAFWNDIMAEHAKFIRGLLDPSENELINQANHFACEFDNLKEAALAAVDKMIPLERVTGESIKATKDIIDFKAEATKGVLDCKIKMISTPLLADHVLREANHYLRVLHTLDKSFI